MKTISALGRHESNRRGPGKIHTFLILALIAAFTAFGSVGVGSEAHAGYSVLQAKMAGHYDDGYRRPVARKRTYKKRNRSGKKTYRKYKKKKTYSKNRNKKKRYAKQKQKKSKPSYNLSVNGAIITSSKKTLTPITKVASLSPDSIPAAPTESLSGGGVRWIASASCLNGTLKSIIYQVAANYGPVTVNSTCRSKKRNARVGGARKSWHLTGNAVDFRVHKNHRAAYAFLKSHGSIGGYKHYGGGLFHIDVGPRRTW